MTGHDESCPEYYDPYDAKRGGSDMATPYRYTGQRWEARRGFVLQGKIVAIYLLSIERIRSGRTTGRVSACLVRCVFHAHLSRYAMVR
jgi:hypothetical protein